MSTPSDDVSTLDAVPPKAAVVAPRPLRAGDEQPSLDPIASALSAAEDRWLADQLVRGMFLYMLLWFSACCTDAVLVFGVGVVSVPRYVAARLLPLPLMGAIVLWNRKHRSASQAAAQRWLIAVDLLTTAWIGLVARESGGLESPAYLFQIFVSISLLVIPLPWRKGAVRHAIVQVAFVALALGFHALRVREGRDTWDVSRHYGFLVLAMCVHALSASLAGTADVLFRLFRAELSARTVGRYQLRRRIGRGGMAEIWAAWHTTLRREVALKLVRTDTLLSPERARRFEREVEAMVRLRHPNTVRVFDFGSEPAALGGLLYYAMELLEGEHVGALVRREGPLPAARARQLGLQVARALAEAHEQGIVHRDVKPENIFVATAGSERDLVKVLDFGIAYVIDPTRERLTHEDIIAGTPATISPEVLRGETPTAASDVYALGCVLYFMVTGSMPFSSAKNVHVFEAHLRQTPIAPSAVRGDALPEALEQLILRCLDKNPAVRPSGGSALAFELASISD